MRPGLGSRAVRAARARPSPGFINHAATVNGRKILLLVVDWDVSPVTVCAVKQRGSVSVRVCVCVPS